MDKTEHRLNADDGYDAGYCLGVVTGVSDMLDMCDPGTTNGQKVRIVVKYLEEHTEKLNLKATVLVKLSARIRASMSGRLVS